MSTPCDDVHGRLARRTVGAGGVALPLPYLPPGGNAFVLTTSHRMQACARLGSSQVALA